jgi:hypothetical protein
VSTARIANKKNNHDGLVEPSVTIVMVAANTISRTIHARGRTAMPIARRISPNVTMLYARCRVKMINEEWSIKNQPPSAGSMYHEVSAIIDKTRRATATFETRSLALAPFIAGYTPFGINFA